MAPFLYITTVLLTFLPACCAEVANLGAPHNNQSLYERAQRLIAAYRSSFALEGPNQDPLGDSELLDIVLVASVDGKFHALNRTTGHTLWSMSSLTSSSRSTSTPAPLIRTSHIDYDPADEGAYPETYIIEPQSGDIYVTTAPSSPLKRFPFSIPELVDMSPFSFASADDHRVFVGRKETWTVAVELETGKVRVVMDPICPRNPLEDLHNDDELDLDESDGRKPSKRTEVFISRTDYHVSIHTRPSSKHRIPVQNLSFSTYGPNSQDNILQASYRNTKDDVYIQSLPNGGIMSFKTRREAKHNSASDSVLWAYTFSNPIVTIFDVLRSPTHPQNTFVLLQPRPQLSAILPKLSHAIAMNQLPHVDSAYIGMVEETGSLFAMSPDRFPLVVFRGGKNNVPLIEPPTKDDPTELPREVDAVTAVRKQREKAMKERNYGSEDDRCQDRTSLYTDRRCLVGIRSLEGGDGESSEMRMTRLIDGVPAVASQCDC
ncbi:hypothetical protein B0H19DRAFT_205878 [Mycena capillaripes]|nr:hypothetical protein B0H19DRAFT_205878 [Mycena capillaripes]